MVWPMSDGDTKTRSAMAAMRWDVAKHQVVLFHRLHTLLNYEGRAVVAR